MNKFRTVLAHGALAAVLSVSALAATSTGASADVVCNRAGDCWHVKGHDRYPARAHVVVHKDNWRWHGNNNRWREHEGRGYWNGGVWIGL